MFFREPTFPVAAALLLGYDLALEGGLLSGFREWLIPRANAGNELSWEDLVLQLAFPAANDPYAALVDDETNVHAIGVLFELVASFLEERQASDGVRRILMTYEGWLRSQRWYQPGHPAWIEMPDTSPAPPPNARAERG